MLHINFVGHSENSVPKCPTRYKSPLKSVMMFRAHLLDYFKVIIIHIV